MLVKKNNIQFNVKGKFSEEWFKDINKWEKDTFYILDNYKNQKNGIYIDIGSWIGPTILYAANLFYKVIAIEPDPVAIERLEENLSVNNFNNIKLIKKGISNITGKSKFGGNGDLGNSESTLLIANDDFLTYEGRHTTFHHQNSIVEIDTITIDKLLEDENINPYDITLIKMDIEGGEVIVVPHIKNFLSKYKPTLYISLHPCFLRKNEIDMIIDILFSIYDKCIFFTPDGKKIKVSKVMIQKYNIVTLVFEK